MAAPSTQTQNTAQYCQNLPSYPPACLPYSCTLSNLQRPAHVKGTDDFILLVYATRVPADHFHLVLLCARTRDGTADMATYARHQHLGPFPNACG